MTTSPACIVGVAVCRCRVCISGASGRARWLVVGRVDRLGAGDGGSYGPPFPLREAARGSAFGSIGSSEGVRPDGQTPRALAAAPGARVRAGGGRLHPPSRAPSASKPRAARCAVGQHSPLPVRAPFCGAPMTTSSKSILVVIRGDSGSGKSTVARALRYRFGKGSARSSPRTSSAAPSCVNAMSRARSTSR